MNHIFRRWRNLMEARLKKLDDNGPYRIGLVSSSKCYLGNERDP